MTAPLNNIEQLAERAKELLLEAIPNFSSLPPLTRAVTLSKALDGSDAPLSRLRAACSADDSLGSLRQGWIQIGSAGHLIQDQMLPIMIVRKLFDGELANRLIADCRAFAADGTSGSTFYSAIAGISVDRAVALSAGVRLLPWADVPDSYQKQAFDGADADLAYDFRFAQMRATPGAAVSIDGPVQQALFPSYPNLSDADHARRGQEMTTNFEKVQDAVRCITAQVGQAVGLIGSWVHVEQKIAKEFASSGYSYGADLFDRTLFQTSLHPVPIDGSSIVALFRNFERFNDTDRRVLRIALDRIRLAFCEFRIVDRAIDLGIALEALLLHDASRDRGELKFRAAVRGAAFLAGSKSKRLETFALLKSAYDHRSIAVHTGEFSKRPERVLEDVKAALLVGAEIARKIVSSGRFPKWDEEFVVGAEPPAVQTGWKPFKPRMPYRKSQS